MGPLFDIIEGLPKFIKHSIDDFVEDSIKIAMLYTTSKFHSNLMPRSSNTLVDFTVNTLSMLFYYWFANEVSDNTADKIDEWKNSYFELKDISIGNKTNSQNFAIDFTEDLVEDSVKFSMLYSSYKVGTLIANSHIFETFLSSTHLPYGRNAGKILDFTVKWVTPITEYTRCNEYSDKAGDFFQYYAEEFLNYIFSNPTNTTSDELQ